VDDATFISVFRDGWFRIYRWSEGWKMESDVFQK
jgi:hypothetical protein